MSVPKMTAQEILHKVATHLLAQGERSYMRAYDGKSICGYRGHGGRKCAIGVLIPDSEYSPYMEGHLWWGLRLEWPRCGRLLTDIQRLHDFGEPHAWPWLLTLCAYAHGLEVTWDK